MAEGVVDLLQVIHIHKDEASRLLLHALGDGSFTRRPGHDACGDIDGIRCTLGGKSLHDFLQQGGRGSCAAGGPGNVLIHNPIQPAFLQQFQEYSGVFRIKLGTPALLQFMPDVFRITGFPVDAVGAHGIEGIGDCDDPRLFGNVRAFQAHGITPAVIAFMMAARHVLRGTDHGTVPQDIAAHGGVRFDDAVLHFCQPFRVVQDGIGHTDLSDIVEQSRIAKITDPVRVPAQLLRNQHGILADPRGVALGIGILRVDGVCQRLDRLERHLLDLFCPFLRHGGLTGHLGIQPLRVPDFKEHIAVILDHGDHGKDGQAEIRQRETVHKGRRIVFRRLSAEGRIEHNEIQQGIIGGEQDPQLDGDKIAHADGQHEGPEDTGSFKIAGQRIYRKDDDTEQGGNQDGDLPPLQYTAAEGAAGAGSHGDKGHDDGKRGQGALAEKDIRDNQHHAQQCAKDADNRHGRQVFLQPVTDKNRLVQVLPYGFQAATGGCSVLPVHFIRLPSVIVPVYSPRFSSQRIQRSCFAREMSRISSGYPSR